MGMETNQNPTTTANPTCDVCHGTGRDDVFGTDCTECWVDARRNEMLQANYANVRTTNADRAYTPGDRMDGRTWGNTNADRTPGGATIKAHDFMVKLLGDRPIDCALRTQMADADTQAMTAKAVSTCIDNLKALAKWERDNAPAPTTTDRGNRTNRYPGSCVDCGTNVAAEAGVLFKVDGKWATAHHAGDCPEATTTDAPTTDDGMDLTTMVSGRYAVPGGDTRLKVQIDVVTEGRWAGWVFVRDAAEYGNARRYGKQAPGATYVGDITDELAAIMADPKAAAIAYGRLVGRCGVCHRNLENEDSVAAGIGPVCATKF